MVTLWSFLQPRLKEVAVTTEYIRRTKLQSNFHLQTNTQRHPFPTIFPTPNPFPSISTGIAVKGMMLRQKSFTGLDFSDYVSLPAELLQLLVSEMDGGFCSCSCIPRAQSKLAEDMCSGFWWQSTCVFFSHNLQLFVSVAFIQFCPQSSPDILCCRCGYS